MIERAAVEGPEAMRELGRGIGARLRRGDLVVLTGPLGAGKTTLTGGLADGVGVRGPVSSPTFVLARTHPSLVGGPPLVHVDAYRLGSAAALDDLDLDYEGAVVVVEWGAGLVDGVADSLLEIRIERPAAAPSDEDGAEPRLLVLERTGPRWAEEPLLLPPVGGAGGAPSRS
jgi:tRNA threonylcarbamoyladenosine biosynthesis protein TsaE